MIVCFYLNIAIGYAIFEISKRILSNESQAFFFATGHPLSRVTIFFMGICGGLNYSKRTSAIQEIETEGKDK